MRIVSVLPATTDLVVELGLLPQWRQVVAAQPDILPLMPCGFPPVKTEQELKRLKGFDAADRRYIVDGPAYFNRPGPRVVDGVELLAKLFHQAG
jgi:iron complex transport system substrate-binding protein